MIRRLLALPPIAIAALVLSATVAGAHVELDPGEAVAGSTTTLTFSFHHGKDGTATTGLDVLLPEGASVVNLPEVEGWTSEVGEDGTISWSGGSVPDGEDGVFPVEVKLPDAPGQALFKTVQITEAGELAWIEEEEGHEEGSYPAPRLTLVADPDATTSTSTTSEPEETTTTEAERDLPGTALEAQQRDDGDGSAAPWIISGIAAVAVVGLGGWALKRRTG